MLLEMIYSSVVKRVVGRELDHLQTSCFSGRAVVQALAARISSCTILSRQGHYHSLEHELSYTGDMHSIIWTYSSDEERLGGDGFVFWKSRYYHRGRVRRPTTSFLPKLLRSLTSTANFRTLLQCHSIMKQRKSLISHVLMVAR